MKILFVCLGNICRSPMAEEIMRALVSERGLDSSIVVDSAGTGGWHAGESADPRTIATLRRHGIECGSIARQLESKDFSEFDLILAMDRQNLSDILAWPGTDPSRVRMLLDCEVPDPYYGGGDGFERMYVMLRRACEGLLTEFDYL